MIEKITQICNSELELEIDSLKEEDKLCDVGIDSIALMTLIVYLEEELDHEIMIDDLMSKPYDTLTVLDLISIL